MKRCLLLARPGEETARDCIQLHEISSVRGTTMGQTEGELGFVGGSPSAPSTPSTRAVAKAPTFSFDAVDEALVTAKRLSGSSPVRGLSKRMSHYHINSGGVIQIDTRAEASMGARSFVLSVNTAEEVLEWVAAIEGARKACLKEIKGKQSCVATTRRRMSRFVLQ